MVLLLTDVFLLLTQILLWIIVGAVIWFFLQKILSKQFLGILVLLLLLAVIVMAFFNGGINDPGSILDILWRVISFPLSPFGLGIIFLVMLLRGVIKGKVVKRLMISGLILLLIGSIPIVSYVFVRELETEAVELIEPVPALSSGARQVIVLLGNDTTRFQLRPRRGAAPANPPKVERPITENEFQVLSTLPIQITAHGNRIIYAAQLYQEENRRGTNPLIVVSAGRRSDRMRKDGETREEITEATDIQTMLTQTFAVPEAGILLDHNNGNIHSSAETVQKLLQDQKIGFGNQLILVASAINMNRAALTFRQVFDESRIVARPTDFFTVPSKNKLAQVVEGRDLVEREVQVTDILPTASSFYQSSQAFQEYLNSLYYFLRGWIKPFQAPSLTRPLAPTAPAAGSAESPTVPDTQSSPAPVSPAPVSPAPVSPAPVSPAPVSPPAGNQQNSPQAGSPALPPVSPSPENNASPL